MIDIEDHDRLATRLAELADELALDDSGLVESVLDRIDARPRWAQGARRRGWLVAAALIALVAGVALHPGTRRAMADWLGLDGVRVEVDPGLSLPAHRGVFPEPGPGESRTVLVDGRVILVSAVRATLDDELISKAVGSSAQVQRVDVLGHPGLWISGTPHEVFYRAAGDVLVERVAADTLLWNDGTTLFRVEGFDDLGAALDYVEGT
jgi:hypothetical protein